MIVRNISNAIVYINGSVQKNPNVIDLNDGSVLVGQDLNLTYGNESDGTVAMSLEDIYEGSVLEAIEQNKIVVMKDGQQLTKTESLNYYYLLPLNDYVDLSDADGLTDIITEVTTFTFDFNNVDNVTVTHNKGKRPLTEVFIESLDGQGNTVFSKSDEPTVHSSDLNSFSMQFPQVFSGFIIYKF